MALNKRKKNIKMKSFKELIIRKKFITFILSLFIIISGLLFFLLGLIMLDVPAIAGVTIIFSIILMFIGYMIPKAIIKLENDKYNRLQQEHNEIKDVIKNLQYIKIANDNEKQNFILGNKIEKYMPFPIYLAFYSIIFYSLLFIITGFMKYNNASSLILVGIVLLAIDTVIFHINKNKNKKYIQKIMDSKIYVADCYSYDKKIEKHRKFDFSRDRLHISYNIFYFIKITDGDYFINKWFPIEPEHYRKTNIEVKLYLSDEIDICDIIPN